VIRGCVDASRVGREEGRIGSEKREKEGGGGEEASTSRVGEWIGMGKRWQQ
jgi:hypothetical protein